MFGLFKRKTAAPFTGEQCAVDISKDGMMSGPNFDMLNVLNLHLNMDIIASGGIASADHLKKLEEMNLYGAITGKALYEGRIDLREAVKRFEEG